MKSMDLIPAIKAGYPMFYCQTQELNRTVSDIQTTLSEYKNGDSFSIKTWDFDVDPDPETVTTLLADEPRMTVVIAKNYNWFIKDEFAGINKATVQFLQNKIETFSSAEYRKILIIVSDSPFNAAIPDQLKNDFLPLEFDLPNIEEIRETYNYIVDSVRENPKFKEPSKEEAEKIVLNARGLTKRGIINALSFSLVKDAGKLNPRTVADIRNREIEGKAGLTIGRYTETFADIQGYDSLKQFCKATIMGPRPDLAKGVNLLGPPGTGKSMFAKSLGNETGLEVITAEIALMFDKYVGGSEKNIREFIDIAIATRPNIIFLDELDKALSKIGGGGSQSESGDGVAKQAMAQFLKFLQDRPEGIYVVATCNSLNIPPEWIRAERWDCAPFFVDLPDKPTQDQILKYYQKQFSVTGRPKNMDGWSGAEIKSACRIAAMWGRSVGEIEQFVVPVSKTMATEIDALRKWAIGKTIPASVTVPNAVDIGSGKKKRAISI